MSPPQEIIIIGTGVFGISTAISLAKRHPSTKIHVFDRYEPPVADGSSVDTTRCLRTDYNDPVYEKLSYEAMQLIMKDPEISKFFNICGMSVIYDGKEDKWKEFHDGDLESAKRILPKDDPSKLVKYADSDAVFHSIHKDTSKPETEASLGRETWWNVGYTNYANGFIDAAKAIGAYYERAKTFANIDFTFKPVDKLVYKEGTNQAIGVKLEDGTIHKSDLVVVAAGAWSAKLVNLEDITFSSAIEVAWYKVTKEEEEKWKDMAITTNLSTGINLFPPHEGEIKILRRSSGYKNTITISSPDPLSSESKNISYPRTIMSNPEDWIPEDAEKALRENMKEIMPPLYDRPFDRTKLCWLTQTKTSNFLIDYHPELKNVLLTTGGSAHAWKFVSLIGDKVVDFLNDDLDPVLKEKWSWKDKVGTKDDNSSAPRMKGDALELKDCIRIKGK